jgi:hypothetical protein
VSSQYWRPPRIETGPDGRTYVVRPPCRPEDYTVDPTSIHSLPKNGGSWAFDAELDERDGALYWWTEVDRFIRGGRSWVRMTNSTAECYIDVENADDRIGEIECVDPSSPAGWPAGATSTRSSWRTAELPGRAFLVPAGARQMVFTADQ